MGQPCEQCELIGVREATVHIEARHQAMGRARAAAIERANLDANVGDLLEARRRDGGLRLRDRAGGERQVGGEGSAAIDDDWAILVCEVGAFARIHRAGQKS